MTSLRGSALRSALLLLAILTAAPACLVLSVNPVYDDESMAWEPGLVGAWEDQDDKASLQIRSAASGSCTRLKAYATNQ